MYLIKMSMMSQLIDDTINYAQLLLIISIVIRVYLA